MNMSFIIMTAILLFLGGCSPASSGQKPITYASSKPTVQSDKVIPKEIILSQTWTQEPDPQIKEILTAIKDQINTSSQDKLYFGKVDELNVLWKLPDKHVVYMHPAAGIKMYIPYNNRNIDLAINKANSLTPVITKIFLDSGFKLDDNNSTINIDEPHMYAINFLGFKKDKTYCNYIVELDASSPNIKYPEWDKNDTFYTINISCSDKYDKALAEQKKFFQIIGENRYTYQIQQFRDFYELHTAGLGHGTGSLIIVKVIDGSMKDIFHGQEDPNCTLVNKYQIPKTMAKTCWDPKKSIWAENIIE
jgi:hypothetical protein